MSHPAYVDIYCEKHEKWHQEDICPLCYHEDEPDFCEEHDIELIDGECEMCEHNRIYQTCEDHGEFSGKRCGKCAAEARAEDEHMERYYEMKYGRGEP